MLLGIESVFAGGGEAGRGGSSQAGRNLVLLELPEDPKRGVAEAVWMANRRGKTEIS